MCGTQQGSALRNIKRYKSPFQCLAACLILNNTLDFQAVVNIQDLLLIQNRFHLFSNQIIIFHYLKMHKTRTQTIMKHHMHASALC